MAKLQETKGRFKFQGVVARLDDKSYREGKTQNGAPYRSIRFAVQTSENNMIFVELFGMKRDKVLALRNKDKGQKPEQKHFPWKDRYNLPDKWYIPGLIRVNGEEKVDYDAVELIKEKLENGESVVVNGRKLHSVYNDKVQTRYAITSIRTLDKEIDFEGEDYKEVNAFETQLVWLDEVEETKKQYGDVEKDVAIVLARHINYDESYVDVEYVVDLEKKSLRAMLKKMKKHLSFGDVITVRGLVYNLAIVEEVEDEDIDEDDPFSDVGEEVEAIKTSAITGYINELQITKVDGSKWEKGVYTEEDFKAAGGIDEEDDMDDSDVFDDDGDDQDVEDLFED